MDIQIDRGTETFPKAFYETFTGIRRGQGYQEKEIMSLKGHIQYYEVSRILPPCRNRMFLTQGHEMKTMDHVGPHSSHL